MTLALAVGLLAAAGAACRYLVDQFIQHQHDSAFPWGTFVINVVGSFILGLVTGGVAHDGLSSATATIVGAGFCAGFTTFSTWMWESLALSETGSLLEATLNVVGSLAVGLAAAASGFALANGIG
jgi:CrcB protein